MWIIQCKNQVFQNEKLKYQLLKRPKYCSVIAQHWPDTQYGRKRIRNTDVVLKEKTDCVTELMLDYFEKVFYIELYNIARYILDHMWSNRQYI